MTTRMPNAQHIILLHRLRRLLLSAAERGIDVAPIKGAHLITSVYSPDEDRGAMADVDLLVRAQDWDRARQLMLALGFAPRAVGRWLPLEEDSHEAGFELPLSDRSTILFEVHRFLFDPLRLPIDHHAIWDRSVPSTLDGAPCRRLAAEDHFVHLVLHAIVHRLLQLPRAVDDLERLLRRGGADLAVTVERAGEWHARRGLWLMLELLAERSSDLGCGEVAERLAPPVAVRKVLRWAVPSERAHRFTHLHHRLQAALLWPLLFDGWTDAVRIAAGHPALQLLATRVFRRF